MGEDVEKLKQRWPLLDYLQKQNWVAQPRGLRLRVRRTLPTA